MEQYADEVEKYIQTINGYENLTDVDHKEAFELMQDSLILAERFSEILYSVRKNNKRRDTQKDVELKDRVEHIYKLLKEIHTDCRMIWNRGKEVPR